TIFIMWFMSVGCSPCESGAKSTMRNTVPDFGGARPILVLPRSAVEVKSGRLVLVTQTFAAEFGGRGAGGCVRSSILPPALPDGSRPVTTRRTSGCCARTEPASVAPAMMKSRFRFMSFLPVMNSSWPGAGSARAVEHRHRGGDHARDVGEV